MSARTAHFQRGSALLIVLAMLTFMIISAVGFSVYMRQSRVPSSHLRRESLSRYLLKSALANAVARLDGKFDKDFNRVEGIYDDPYPGFLPSNYDRGTDESLNGDYWEKRVFTPFGHVDPLTTVSTLTLEGLGYVPPAIINEVRVLSRTTRTARWKNMSYDLGRYAFCAIDVSDCFDVNKLATVKRRSSNAGERISLASLYPEDPDDLVTRIKAAPKFSVTPFISLADFNLALGNTDYTPFVRYVNSGGNNGNMYLEDDTAVSNALFITDTWFPATNAYLTAELELKNAAADTTHYFDLTTERGQPFKEDEYDVASFLEIKRTTPFAQQLERNLGMVGMTCLMDYLDEDHYPLSLGLPTVEAVPMVCGVNLAGLATPLFEKGSPPTGVQGEETWSFEDKNCKPATRRVKRTVETVYFKGLDDPSQLYVSGTVMFPFKRFKKENRPVETFTVQALVAVFFGSTDLRCRLTENTDIFRPTEEDWARGGSRNGVYFYRGEDILSEVAGLTTKDITKTDEAFAKFSCRLQAASGATSLPVFHIVNEEEITTPTMDPTAAAQPVTLSLEKNTVTLDGFGNLKNTFMLYAGAGANVGTFQALMNGKDLMTGTERAKDAPQGATTTKQRNAASEFQDATSYVPYITVWVRVVSNGDVFDLAPATCADDATIGDGSEKMALAFEKVGAPMSGDGVPLLDFRDTREEAKFVFSDSKLTQLPQFEPQGWKSLYAVDPRYNFAPEDWFGNQGNDANPQQWRTLMKANANDTGYFGLNGRDRDIFMFTSDQEHLQSIGELQFLPYVQELGRNINYADPGFKNAARYTGENFDVRTDPASSTFANGYYFWKTYSGYSGDENKPYADPYYDLLATDKTPIVVVNGSGDFRVNPLSDDTRVISAAVADTPWDYYIASTNKETNMAISSVEGSPENYAFGTVSSLAADQWSEKAVNGVAGALRAGIRNGASSSSPETFDWGEYYEDVWYDQADLNNGLHDEQKRLFGVDLGSGYALHGVDRKFLFSYWRECFQNRQQLFLIFIRAEPLTVGGSGVVALSPAQLGARGVALVWRDPAPPKSTGSTSRRARNAIMDRESWRTQMQTCPPHRTRVLFYHQFD